MYILKLTINVRNVIKISHLKSLQDTCLYTLEIKNS